MRIARWIVVVAIAVAGCSDRSAEPTETAAKEMNAAAGQDAPAPAAEAAPVAESASRTPASVALPQIAYRYDFTLELPTKAVMPLFERHRQACEAAGAARCQIVGAETTNVDGTDTQATLTLRAQPDWLAGFRSRLGGDARGADGEIARSQTESEDLGRQLSDTGARLRALTTLQGRLEALLANRSGKLADLLEIERELARVGGEIDETRSALADMRGRVALPKATIRYRPDSLIVADADATSGLGGLLYEIARTSLVALLSLIVAVLPWLAVLVPLGWLLRRLTRSRPEA